MLVDAGPLVAILDRGDRDHEWCVAALKTLRDPLVTVWPAFTEAMYLLGGSREAQKALWSRVETDALALAPLDEADAALVHVAERESLTDIFTLDRKHFSLYRPGRRRRSRSSPSSRLRYHVFE